MKIFRKGGARFCFAKGQIYCLDPIFLDIETANNHAKDPKDMITWIVSIQVQFNKKYYLFRYPEELIDFYKGLYKTLGLKPGKFRKTVITYIHNLSYDISYLKPYLDQLPYETGDYKGIVEAPNKFLTYVKGPFEFRCSYRLSGMSLEKWGNEYNISDKKKIGLYDYEKVLYPDSELNEAEQDYDKHDIISMAQCLQKQMIYFKDNIVSIPLTMTGYIRRELRRSCKNDKRYRNKYFWNTRLSADIFEICLKSFGGGYTHSNRYYNDLLLECGKEYEYIPESKDFIRIDKMKHRDFKSHYPTQARAYLMPIGKPQHIYESDMGFPYSIQDILEDYPDFISFCVIRIYKAELRSEEISMPFMQYSRMFNKNIQKIRLDNGRVLSMDGYCVMFLDNLTLQIFAEQYSMEYEIVDVWRFAAGPLPDAIAKVIDKYFKEKSDYKNVVKKLTKEKGKLDPETVEAEFELMQRKKGLNSTYGCMVMNPLRTEFTCNENMEFHIGKEYRTLDQMEKGLEDFYKKYNNFLPYQVGCMITAAARFELYEYIKAIGYKNCLYCDTDSIFYISTPEIEEKIVRLNGQKHEKAPYVVLDNGEVEYYDCFEEEPDLKAFKALRSKCYGIVTDKGLEITIAGVPTRTLIDMYDDEPVYYTREEELSEIRDKEGKIMEKEKDPVKALDHLDDSFIFHVNTGVSALYVGAEGYNKERKPKILNIDGHEIHTAGGCVIRRLKEKQVSQIGMDNINSDNYDEQISIDSLR